MLPTIARRIALAVPVVLGVTTLVFLMLHFVPGDAATAIFGERGASPEQIAQVRHVLGLDQPLPVQYWNYLSRIARADLGESLVTHESVAELIGQNLLSTVQLAFAGIGLAILLGVSLGVVAAARRGSVIDAASMAAGTLGVSMPSFWLGLLLILVFAIQLRWVPITSGDDLARLALPAIALGLQAAAIIARMVRTTLLDVLQEDYVRTARAKGLQNRVVLFRHALRSALLPVVTVVGLQFGSLLGGAVIVESVFARQGIGRLLVSAIQSRDFPLAQGCVLLIALVYVVVNLVVDLLYVYLDPRVRYSGSL